MKSLFAAAILGALAFAAQPAQAAGCLSGAAMGGVAGHFAHHGVLGAAAGCAVGHHEAVKNRRANQQQQQQQPTPTSSPQQPASVGQPAPR